MPDPPATSEPKKFEYLPPTPDLRRTLNLMNPETSKQKLVRRCKEQPLIPIGKHLYKSFFSPQHILSPAHSVYFLQDQVVNEYSLLLAFTTFTLPQSFFLFTLISCQYSLDQMRQ